MSEQKKEEHRPVQSRVEAARPKIEAELRRRLEAEHAEGEVEDKSGNRPKAGAFNPQQAIANFFKLLKMVEDSGLLQLLLAQQAHGTPPAGEPGTVSNF